MQFTIAQSFSVKALTLFLSHYG